MKEQIDNLIQWIKEQPIKGCITGSALLDYFEGQDVDVFTYNDKSFTLMMFAMYYNPMFTLIDKLEKWKFDQYITKEGAGYKKLGLITIKFIYNTCVPINIILKKDNNNIFDVISAFDMDIISKGYDIETKQYLDLTGDSTNTKIASWNKWNTKFYDTDLWSSGQILRQIERCFKYYDRGYNTDSVILKYIEICNGLKDIQNIFKSPNYDKRLEKVKTNVDIVKEICQKWLENHKITEKEKELLKQKINEI